MASALPRPLALTPTLSRKRERESDRLTAINCSPNF